MPGNQSQAGSRTSGGGVELLPVIFLVAIPALIIYRVGCLRVRRCQSGLCCQYYTKHVPFEPPVIVLFANWKINTGWKRESLNPFRCTLYSEAKRQHQKAAATLSRKPECRRSSTWASSMQPSGRQSNSSKGGVGPPL